MNRHQPIGTTCRLVVHSCFGIVICITALTQNSVLAQPNLLAIDWEVQQRFRNFDFLGSQPSNQRALEAWNTYSPRSSDDSLVSWLNRLQSEGHLSPYADTQNAWNEESVDPKQIYRSELVEAPKTYAVTAKLIGFAGPAVQECSWTLTGSVPITAPCVASVRINLPHEGAIVEVSSLGQLIARDSVHPRFRIILGLGDSYGSGQGNPDRPTKWNAQVKETRWTLGDIDWTSSYVVAPANWQSNRCNRSFWSHQHMAALKSAADDRHSVVSFVHLSCTGAEIVDGMLAPQRKPSGRNLVCDSPENRKGQNAEQVDPQCDVPYSQIRAAVELLCSEPTIPVAPSDYQAIRAEIQTLELSKKQAAWINELRACGAGKQRPIDRIFVSIGGNDIGFAGVIAWGLLPLDSKTPIWELFSDFVTGVARKDGGVICPYPRATKGCDVPSAQERMRELDGRFNALAIALKKLLEVNGSTIVLTGYPNPLKNARGEYCGDRPYSNEPNRWYALHYTIPQYVSPSRWQLNLTPWETEQVDKQVVPRLNDALQRAASANQWHFVDARQAMANRGWCTGPDPTLPPPSKAVNWNAYSDHVRRVRTGNDSFLTQWAISAGRADWLSGVFHPNAHGHAAVADLIARESP